MLGWENTDASSEERHKGNDDMGITCPQIDDALRDAAAR